jgi:hypothetical protein
VYKKRRDKNEKRDSENQERRHQLGDLYFYGKIILKWILKKLDVIVQTGLSSGNSTKTGILSTR